MVDQTGASVFTFGAFPTVTSRTIQKNNPLVQVITVEPSKFKQHQFTTKLDGQLSEKNTLSGTLFYANFPGLDSFPDLAAWPHHSH